MSKQFLRDSIFWFVLAMAAITAVAFAGTLSNGFVNFDDDRYVYANPMVQQGLTAEGLKWSFTTLHEANWHPLTWLSLELDSQLFGTEPWGYHFTNLLLHVSNAVLLFLFLAYTTGCRRPSFFAAALFAVHPLHVESVAWAAERKDVLSTLFWMLTLLAYAGYVRRANRGLYVLALVMAAVGLTAKPMLVTMPFVLLLLDYWPLGRIRFGQEALPGGDNPPPVKSARFGPLLTEKIPFFVLSAVSSAVTLYAQRAGGAVASIEGLSLVQRVINSLAAYEHYLAKTIWPSGLAVFYPHPTTIEGAGAGWQAPLGLVLLLGITIWAIKTAGRRPYLVVGWFWFVGTLVPVIGLVQIGSQFAADRYTYVPLVGIFVAVSWTLRDSIGKSKAGRVALWTVSSAAVLACMLLTARQVTYWHDGRALWNQALAVTRRNFVAHDHLAELAMLDGDIDEALFHAEAELRIVPWKTAVQKFVADKLFERGDFEGAAQHYEAMLKYDNRDAATHAALAAALLRLDRLGEARAECIESLNLDPKSTAASQTLGQVLARQQIEGR